MLDYTNVECPVCKKPFTEKDDIVVCPECGTPHHRECYFSLSHCVNEEKHAEGYVFEMPRIKQIEKQILNGDVFKNENNNEAEPEIKVYNQDENGGEMPPVISTPILGGMGQLGIDVGENPKIADIPIDEVTAFVGVDQSSSRLIFKLAIIDKLKTVRLNFITLFFPYLWFFYRKMYKVGALVIALMLASTLIFTNANTLNYNMKIYQLAARRAQGAISVEEYNAAALELSESGTGNSEYFDMAPQVLNLAIRIVFALLANKLYLEHMKKQVFKAREDCSSMEEYMDALRKRGGKSVGAAVLSVVLFSAVSFIGYYALYMIYM